jgi:hypothetical protein
MGQSGNSRRNWQQTTLTQLSEIEVSSNCGFARCRHFRNHRTHRPDRLEQLVSCWRFRISSKSLEGQSSEFQSASIPVVELRKMIEDRILALPWDGPEHQSMAIPSNKAVADRIAPRYVFETRIRITLQRDTQRVAMLGWTRDLSESGVAAFVAQGLSLGELVTLEIPLPQSGKQVIPAKVARTLGTEYGFVFTALSAEQRLRIQAAMEGQPAIPYPGAGQKR